MNEYDFKKGYSGIILRTQDLNSLVLLAFNNIKVSHSPIQPLQFSVYAVDNTYPTQVLHTFALS